MAKKTMVTIDALSRNAVKYNNVLRELPFFYLNEAIKNLKISIIDVQGEDVLITKRRRAGILAPYSLSMDFSEVDYKELMKFFEAKLKPELAYAEEFDNITNYKEKKIISNMGEILDNKAKKHPLEFMILQDLTKAHGEDVAFSLFFAQRDEAVKSPMTAFNGFNYKLNLLKIAGEIDKSKNNLVETGEFKMPTSDTDYESYDKLVAFIKGSNPLLLKGAVELRAADNPITAAREALKRKLRYQEYPTLEKFMEHLRSDTGAKKLELLQDEAYGYGDQLMLTKPGLLDAGVMKLDEGNFVQVRQFGRDPNVVQFWMQAGYDTRINDIHPKEFRMNDQLNKDNLHLAGDYQLEVEDDGTGSGD